MNKKFCYVVLSKRYRLKYLKKQTLDRKYSINSLKTENNYVLGYIEEIKRRGFQKRFWNILDTQ